MALILEDKLLKASLLCGMKPNGPPVYRLQLFFVVNKDLQSKNHQGDLQRALETGVDEKRFWYRVRKAEYRITEDGYKRACEKFGDLPAVYPPTGIAEFKCTLRGLIGEHIVVLRASGKRWAVFVDDKQYRSAKEACRKLGQALNRAIPTSGESAPRVLYNFALDNHFEMLWEGPTISQHAVERDIEEFVDVEELEDPKDQEIDSLLRAGRLRIEVAEATTEVALSNRRKGQERLRQLTLKHYEGQCAMCDMDDLRLLVTSHIVPWAEDPEARLRPDNCMCLCRFHDALFECGYWSLSEDFEVLVKEGIKSPTIRNLLAEETCFRMPLSYTPAQEYLARHRQKHGFAD